MAELLAEQDADIKSFKHGDVVEGIGLVESGVILDQSGYVRVDRVSRTGARGVYAAGDCTEDCRDIRSATAANSTAGDAANHSAGRRTDNRAGAFNLHRAHAFDDAHAHILLASRFVPGIGTAAQTFRTTGQHCRRQYCRCNLHPFVHFQFSCHHNFMLNARRKRSAISSRPIR